MRRDFLRRSGSPKSVCRERLRKVLVGGRRAECLMIRFLGLLVTGILFAGVSGWLSEDFAFSLAPEVQKESFFRQDRLLQELYRPPSEEAEAVPDESSAERTVEVTLKKGDNLHDVLARQGMTSGGIQELVQALRPVHDVKRLQQGNVLVLVYDERDWRLLRFETLADKDHLVIVERGENGLLTARKEAFDYEIRTRSVRGTIDGSLFMAVDKAGLPTSVAVSLTEVFDCDIDFHTEIRSTDTFQILVEEKYLDGQFVRFGRILGARITSQGRPFWAFSFKGANGRAEYYDREGRSLRKAFLKSPLKYTRITSGFTHSRFHPVLQIYRPHLGVDYAAPTGTPVRAVAHGRISFAGWEGGFGNMVKIQHNGSLTSMYGHLSRMAPGVHTGASVSQGQLIGYVGATGLATGPHLDFRLVKNGQFINPLKVNTLDGDPVPKDQMAAFRQMVAQRIGDMEKGSTATAMVGTTASR